jgi:transcriptional antiterminator RfaH
MYCCSTRQRNSKRVNNRMLHYPKVSDTDSWYVIHTRPKQEDRVENNLSTMGIQTFVPRIIKHHCNKYSDRLTHIVKPFFSNYVFAQFDVSKLLHKIRFARGVHSVVCYGTAPAPVDSWIIDTIQSQIAEDGFIRIDESLKPGDEVIVENDLLKDFRGIFERETSDAYRVMILLQTVSYQAHLVIERDLLKKVSAR